MLVTHGVCQILQQKHGLHATACYAWQLKVGAYSALEGQMHHEKKVKSAVGLE